MSTITHSELFSILQKHLTATRNDTTIDINEFNLELSLVTGIHGYSNYIRFLNSQIDIYEELYKETFKRLKLDSREIGFNKKQFINELTLYNEYNREVDIEMYRTNKNNLLYTSINLDNIPSYLLINHYFKKNFKVMEKSEREIFKTVLDRDYIHIPIDTNLSNINNEYILYTATNRAYIQKDIVNLLRFITGIFLYKSGYENLKLNTVLFIQYIYYFELLRFITETGNPDVKEDLLNLQEFKEITTKYNNTFSKNKIYKLNNIRL